MKRQLKQGWASPSFWKIRDKLAFETDKKKLDVIDDLTDYVDKNYDKVMNHILHKKPIKKLKRFEMRF